MSLDSAPSGSTLIRASSKKVIVQIVPALSPPSTGVGDYALQVARQLKAGFAIDTVFLVGNPGVNRAEAGGGFQVRTVAKRSAAGILRELEEIDARLVLLQLSPYGYEKSGCPFWLARGLDRWIRGGTPRRKLITMFHELYAEGPPWTRAFWLSGLQKRAARAILDSTSFVMTGVQKFAQQLEAWRGEGKVPVRCLPVPSNVGEPAVVPLLVRRKRRICAFGIRAGENPLSGHMAGKLESVIRHWAIEEIAVVGDSPATRAFDGLGCRVESYKRLDAKEVSRILSDSVLGLSWYPPEALAKSGVYAAYCAHGVPALVLGLPGKQAPSQDGLELGRHYLPASGVSERWDPERLQRVSDNGRQWYAGHGVQEHARAVAGYIDQESG